MKRISYLATTLMIFSSIAQAQDAGCGLGSMVFRDNSKVFQLLAMTTNHSTLTQPLGITTGTSECKASSIVMREKEVQYFAEVNQDDLSREMAQGQGEKLTALASLYGCQGDASGEFAKMTQTSFERILPAEKTSAGDMIQNLNRELSTNAELSKKCQAI